MTQSHQSMKNMLLPALTICTQYKSISLVVILLALLVLLHRNTCTHQTCVAYHLIQAGASLKVHHLVMWYSINRHGLGFFVYDTARLHEPVHTYVLWLPQWETNLP